MADMNMLAGFAGFFQGMSGGLKDKLHFKRQQILQREQYGLKEGERNKKEARRKEDVTAAFGMVETGAKENIKGLMKNEDFVAGLKEAGFNPEEDTFADLDEKTQGKVKDFVKTTFRNTVIASGEPFAENMKVARSSEFADFINKTTDKYTDDFFGIKPTPGTKTSGQATPKGSVDVSTPQITMPTSKAGIQDKKPGDVGYGKQAKEIEVRYKKVVGDIHTSRKAEISTIMGHVGGEKDQAAQMARQDKSSVDTVVKILGGGKPTAKEYADLKDLAKESKRDVLANVGRAFYILKGRYPSVGKKGGREYESGIMGKLITQLGLTEE